MDGFFEEIKPQKKRTAHQEKNDALFDPLARFFFPTGVGPDDAKRIMKVVRNIRVKKATPEQINVAVTAWGVVFPYCKDALTLEALNKHWDKLLSNGRSAAPPKPRRNEGIEDEAQDHIYQRQKKAWEEWYGKQ